MGTPNNKINLQKLKDFGYKLIGPEIGDMACGEYGEGKMSEPKEIINKLKIYFKNLKLKNKLKAIVTAGPTKEYIDPIDIYLIDRVVNKVMKLRNHYQKRALKQL